MKFRPNKYYINKWEEYVEQVLNTVPVPIAETDKQQKERMTILEEDPEQWFKYYFPKERSEPADFHKAATKRILNNPEWYEVRMWSRELAKSTRTMMEVMYLSLVRNKQHVLLISSSLDNATRLLIPYKANLEHNLRIINDYGLQQWYGNWTASEFTTQKGVTFRAVGAQQPPRGAKNHNNVRPDVILFDDVDTDTDCRNPEMVENNWKWIEGAVIGTRSVDKPTTIVFCGNRIAEDCCVARAAKYADHAEVINITDEEGNSTWPQKNSKADIERVMSQKSYASIQREYFNNPITEGTVFQKMNYKPLPLLSEYNQLVCYTDPSFKDGPKNDYKATVLVGKWKDEFHIIKCFVEQTTTAKMIDWHYEIMQYIATGQARTSCYYYMEQGLLQEIILTEFHKEAAKRGKTIPIQGDQRKKEHKFTRIESLLEPMNRNGQLYLNEAERNNPNMKKLEEQFINLEKSGNAHDDAPDAVEGAVWMINNKLNRISVKDSFFVFPVPHDDNW